MVEGWEEGWEERWVEGWDEEGEDEEGRMGRAGIRSSI